MQEYLLILSIQEPWIIFKDQLPATLIPVEPAIYGKKMPHFVADELFPQFTDSNQLVFLNSSYRLPPEFVSQNTGTDKLTRIKFQCSCNG